MLDSLLHHIPTVLKVSLLGWGAGELKWPSPIQQGRSGAGREVTEA